ncbi:glycosyltransferase [Bacteroides ovatus]|jgi:glycosyltransferase involved in cell wall biosynthesis|uniref:glycosyltransferase n=1 Tax=Bacteroides ovatus TaxID=28116 RepID=UPI0018C8FB42|nr:glycosyltransferase [Bacteroides ovatus]MBG9219731.1 glycosyltransferase [Bacteroides ovatus]MBG9232855.1 glycosyltransferase [Bacteroides ovatus]
MNILYITVRSDFGGGPKHINELLDLSSSEYNIYMASPLGEPYGNLWKNDIRIKGFHILPYRSFSFLELFLLMKFIKANNIEVVHSHGKGAGIYSRLCKLFNPSLKVIHTFHGVASSSTSRLRGVISDIVEYCLGNLTDCFICVSEGERKIVIEKRLVNVNKVFVVYNGIEDKGAKDVLNVSNKIFKIVSLSRFDYAKNMSLAYDIAYAFKDNQNIHFIWVGDGPDYTFLKEKAEANLVNIDFVGFSQEPMKYLKSSDLYLSTSRFEGLPYGLIEAASVGLPIVATNVIGNNEVCFNRVNGFLYTQMEDSIKAINMLYNDPHLMKYMGENSRKIYEEKFQIENMLDGLMKRYSVLLEKRR